MCVSVGGGGARRIELATAATTSIDPAHRALRVGSCCCLLLLVAAVLMVTGLVKRVCPNGCSVVVLVVVWERCFNFAPADECAAAESG